MRKPIARVVGALVTIGVLATAIGLYFGNYGDCKINADCPSGRQCMAWTFDHVPWWAKGSHYRTCEIPCAKREDCPQSYDCTSADHGPGPGNYCSPHYVQ
jgi:hypothetical protein